MSFHFIIPILFQNDSKQFKDLSLKNLSFVFNLLFYVWKDKDNVLFILKKFILKQWNLWYSL